MCNKSESIKNIAAALVKFNGEVKMIEKDAQNPHFKNQYASLDTIIDEVRPLLAKHGLSVLQFPGGDGERFTLRSMLLHESGEWIESEPIIMRPVKNDPQGIGSCSTYARRYSLSAMLSLNTGEDDDGNDATQPNINRQNGTTSGQSYQSNQYTQSSQTAVQRQSSSSTGEMATEGQAKMLNIRTKEIGCSYERISDFLGYEVKAGAEIKKADVNRVLEFISSIKEQIAAS
ncbi:recombinase [Paenibacillus sp. H1-7]|uniref:ERF family protein n=1 Tax=Paenibacillus sp. H1-7 TaxID=2282849 RepID=UPI001EF8DBA7|nr:ERF family protein [Paenibacillus sp. H1-7]ULL14335.1 recombinase [Paenibacillus sp. H1-7]